MIGQRRRRPTAVDISDLSRYRRFIAHRCGAQEGESMKYYLEIYLDGEKDVPDFQAESPTAFPAFDAGGMITPQWRSGSVDFAPGDRCRIDWVEHIVWDEGHKLMVHGEFVPKS